MWADWRGAGYVIWSLGTESRRNSPYLLYILHYWMCAYLSLSIIAGAITNLRVVGYNQSRVNLAWKNPTADYIPYPSLYILCNYFASQLQDDYRALSPRG